MDRWSQTEDGVRYVEHGPVTGGTYVLVHGLGGSLEQWSEIVRRLGHSARVLAIDVPGFGRSRTATGAFDVEAAAATIARFCAAKQVHDSVLVSHSVGCVMAARVAALAPERFRRLVFVSGALVRASELTQHPGRALREPLLGLTVATQFLAGLLPIPRQLLTAMARSALLRSALLRPFVADPRSLDATLLVETLTGTGSPAVLRILFTAKAIAYDTMLRSVQQPVDLITGDADRLIADEDRQLVRALVRVERDVVIDDCGHWPWLEQPAELADLLIASGSGADD
ncbi:alpha/beta fold hydrolase [Actinokineospora globicatena]|uniref:Alpha/beta hydrolase n=1 Tax=Actinokineospora globicatena TaxID=103729 RepID=A0A9W6V7H5_9PSEU|nr:alpha/beta hydrolase [Actinokineospora globicatena]MCP2302725.1 Pimeloyl-ACP methyl ester carboxylesterase [Actinokineospora globicatena]GLW75586.1 alpha/beta hydrolase [Actinokineospora globicatena]GLW82426.1 alpha/beta hydrolase [Actinokineospora globicatena]GLW91367.1 alpha/beta hydrolase [Actinokineospora globicatena]